MATGGLVNKTSIESVWQRSSRSNSSSNSRSNPMRMPQAQPGGSRASSPDTVRDAEHCWQRRNMIRVDESRSSSVSTDLQLLHST